MEKKTLIILASLVVIGSAGIYAFQNDLVPPGTKTYANSTYGLSFEYERAYVLEERSDSAHHAVTLIHRDNMPIPQDGEGPTAITVDVFRYLGSMGAEDWARLSSNSNFQLSTDGEIGVAALSGAEVVTYTWDGLYRGDSVVFAHGDNIVMLSVTYMTPEDTIRTDFANLLATLKLTAPGE